MSRLGTWHYSIFRGNIRGQIAHTVPTSSRGGPGDTVYLAAACLLILL